MMTACEQSVLQTLSDSNYCRLEHCGFGQARVCSGDSRRFEPRTSARLTAAPLLREPQQRDKEARQHAIESSHKRGDTEAQRTDSIALGDSSCPSLSSNSVGRHSTPVLRLLFELRAVPHHSRRLVLRCVAIKILLFRTCTHYFSTLLATPHARNSKLRSQPLGRHR